LNDFGVGIGLSHILLLYWW